MKDDVADAMVRKGKVTPFILDAEEVGLPSPERQGKKPRKVGQPAEESNSGWEPVGAGNAIRVQEVAHG
jgi:hypothetical protein